MAQSITKYVGFIELEDGREIGPVRIGLKSKIQANKTAKARGWNPERDITLINSFMAWHAAKAAGSIDIEWEQFIETALDADVQELQVDPDEDGDPENPTNPEHSDD